MIKRDIEENITKAARYFPVITILGPRQSGKTTLAKKLFALHKYVSLEDLDIRAQANEDPRKFLTINSNEYGLIIDEVQHVPNLLSYIQTVVDNQQKPGFFILTGSQNILVNQAVTQSLAGRNAIITLLPLSISELKNANLMPDKLEKAIFKGCYPKIYATDVPVKMLYNNYISSYVERDVRQIKNILNLSTFQKFLAICAGRVGQLLNLSSLANDCGIDQKTAKAWLSLLESTYIIFLLYPYYKNFGKRLTNMPKLYFVDTGIACNLLNIKNEEDIENHFAKGGLAESLIISDLFKQFYNSLEKPAIYFWRDYQGNEIDCLIEKSADLYPIEIKSGHTIGSDYFKPFTYFAKLIGQENNKNLIVYGGDKDMSRTGTQIISWQDSGDLIKKIFNL